MIIFITVVDISDHADIATGGFSINESVRERTQWFGVTFAPLTKLCAVLSDDLCKQGEAKPTFQFTFLPPHAKQIRMVETPEAQLGVSNVTGEFLYHSIPQLQSCD